MLAKNNEESNKPDDKNSTPSWQSVQQENLNRIYRQQLRAELNDLEFALGNGKLTYQGRVEIANQIARVAKLLNES